MMRKKTRRAPSWYAREWIAYKGLRQADIVERTPFTKSQVSEYINEKRRWNQDVLDAFASALGIERSDLLRQPGHYENELADYVMAMDEERRFRALRVLKALENDHEDGSNGGQKVA